LKNNAVIEWPEGRRFAFTFCDDTDWATYENVKPIYDFLSELGIRTTKLVWPINGNGPPRNGGETCEDSRYSDWLQSLQDQGFEIALHNVAPTTSPREVVAAGFDRFRDLFGVYPRLHCNHTGCLEDLYWGSARLTGWRRGMYDLWTRGRGKNISKGHIVADPLFWGDICRAHVSYVRNFTFTDLNTLRCCPQMPYHDPARPFVNFWFSATVGSSPNYFQQNFTLPKVQRFIGEGGLCIAYVHFGKFYRDGAINEHFRRVMEYVASENGWFAPVSEILDYLRRGEDQTTRSITASERRKLELRWLVNKIGKKQGI
jgi:hypothetical protein